MLTFKQILTPFRAFVVSVVIATPLFGNVFEQLDSNKDGTLSGREVADLKALDQNGDGEISREEFSAVVTEQRSRAQSSAVRLFATLDANDDKRLSGIELSGYESFDSNGDNRITEAEFKTGIATIDAALKNMQASAIRIEAADRFTKTDINEDGRLSGSEAYGTEHFDRNQDARISKEEYVIGTILCAAASDTTETDSNSPTSSPTDEEIQKVFGEFVSAMNDPRNSQPISSRWHASIKGKIDLPVFEYTLMHAKKQHGKFRAPSKQSITKTTLEGGDTRTEANLACDKGEFKLIIRFSQGKIIAFLMDSPGMKDVDDTLYRDLAKEPLQTRFAQYYNVIARGPLKSIMAQDDAVALAWLHPLVVEQVGREPFESLFKVVRERLTEITSYDLEKFESEVSQSGVRKFSVTQILTGKTGTLRYKTTFQILGMCAVLTGLETSEYIENDSVVPMPSPAPEEVTDNSKENWIETASPRDGLAFRAPGKATRTEQSKGNNHLTRFVVELADRKMKFQADVIHLEIDASKDPETFFQSAKEGLLENTGAKLLQERYLDRDGLFPSQVLVVQGADGRTAIRRNIIAGSKVYSFMWTGPQFVDADEKNFARPFHESVKLIDANGALRRGFRIIQDDRPEPATPELPVDPDPSAFDDLAPPPAPPAPPPAPIIPIPQR